MKINNILVCSQYTENLFCRNREYELPNPFKHRKNFVGVIGPESAIEKIEGKPIEVELYIDGKKIELPESMDLVKEVNPDLTKYDILIKQAMRHIVLDTIRMLCVEGDKVEPEFILDYFSCKLHNSYKKVWLTIKLERPSFFRYTKFKEGVL